MAERGPRYSSKGRVFVAEVENTDALLKNLSNSGLCIESNKFMDIVPKARYSVDIIPEEESNLEKFNLEIESRWIKSKMKNSESGFVIVIPSGTEKEVLERYLAYLASVPGSEIEENSEDT